MIDIGSKTVYFHNRMDKITCTKNGEKVKAKTWKQKIFWQELEIDVCSECGADSSCQDWNEFHTIENDYETEK